MADRYEIATFAAGTGALADIRTIVDDLAAKPFPAPFTPYTAIVGVDLNQAPIKQGLPVCSWHWDFMTQADYVALSAFEGAVYIKTRTDQGTWAVYSATMVITQIPNPRMGKLRDDVNVNFYNLVLIP